ncbi:unnamed protein product, partial [Diabrotica balteata]
WRATILSCINGYEKCNIVRSITINRL